jgi:hypothetical protein
MSSTKKGCTYVDIMKSNQFKEDLGFSHPPPPTSHPSQNLVLKEHHSIEVLLSYQVGKVVPPNS